MGHEEEIGGVKMRNTQPLLKDESIKHIDKTGVERVLKASNTHIFSKHKGVTRQNIVKALNSIEAVSNETTDTRRLIAKSQNGLIVIFNGEEIVTCFDPSEKNPSDTAEKYFKRHATKAQIIKQKWWQI